MSNKKKEKILIDQIHRLAKISMRFNQYSHKGNRIDRMIRDKNEELLRLNSDPDFFKGRRI